MHQNRKNSHIPQKNSHRKMEFAAKTVLCNRRWRN